MRVFRTVTAILVVLCILPLLAPMAAGLTASLAGCQLDEGSVHPCEVFGADVGPALYGLGVAGWLMVLTLPALGVVILVWAGIEAGNFLARRRRP